MKALLPALALCASACAPLPGPSVPQQTGHTLQSARAAVQVCSADAPKGGSSAVAGGYVGGVLLGGILLGPIIVAANEDEIRAHGEYSAVDRCLAERGFRRRDLTKAEIDFLNKATHDQRQRFLDHLINGGTLTTFGAASA
ncbi:hypothetical protein [Sedimentitalea todarodis]|uniref:Lipoprotein n=1 Tax=Sedimentitalea todarodis TaxID=1631240 RepID=A0ABU3V8F6_9RHOB|nr:hypothetical protein [Sedimentitalea todarodis]MDU9002383.1 hypothetical protein [Sedimentitalea todarodis]